MSDSGSHDSPVEVAAAVLRDGDRVLLCHRHPDRRWYPNVWDLPGGHVEPGEDPADALVRELAEELALQIPRPGNEPFRRVIDVGVAMTVWLIDAVGPVVNAAPDEHDVVEWFTGVEIPALRLAHPGYIELLTAALDVR